MKQAWIYLMAMLSFGMAQIQTGAISHQLIGPGSYTIDLDSDSQDDFTFDIIALGSGLGLAARVNALADATILDNSTFGYPDALNAGAPVSGYFHSGIGVLGTFNTAGLFKGMGNKFLGIQLHSSASPLFGWIYLRCSNLNDTITLLSYGYQSAGGTGINAGDGIPLAVDQPGYRQQLTVWPNPAHQTICCLFPENGNWSITDLSGREILSGNAGEGIHSIDISGIPSGYYTLHTGTGVARVTVE